MWAWRIALGAGLLAALVAGGWWLHHMIWQAGYNARAAADAQALANARKEQIVVEKEVVTRWRTRVKRVRVRSAAIIQRVPIYVTLHDNARCTVNVGFVRLWNDANRLSVPAPATSADEAASRVTLSDIAAQHARESALTHANDAQLRALQRWVLAQHAIH